MFQVITYDNSPVGSYGRCEECKISTVEGTIHEVRAELEQHARDEHMGMFVEPEHRVASEGANECGLPTNICPHYAAESPATPPSDAADANQPGKSDSKKPQPATLTEMKEAPRVSLDSKFRHVTVHVPIELALGTDVDGIEPKELEALAASVVSGLKEPEEVAEHDPVAVVGVRNGQWHGVVADMQNRLWEPIVRAQLDPEQAEHLVATQNGSDNQRVNLATVVLVKLRELAGQSPKTDPHKELWRFGKTDDEGNPTKDSIPLDAELRITIEVVVPVREKALV